MQWILKDNAQPYSHIYKHTSKPNKSMLPVVSELRINYISVLWALHNNGVHSFCLLFVSPLNIFWNVVTSFLLCVCSMSKAERTWVYTMSIVFVVKKITYALCEMAHIECEYRANGIIGKCVRCVYTQHSALGRRIIKDGDNAQAHQKNENKIQIRKVVITTALLYVPLFVAVFLQLYHVALSFLSHFLLSSFIHSFIYEFSKCFFRAEWCTHRIFV